MDRGYYRYWEPDSTNMRRIPNSAYPCSSILYTVITRCIQIADPSRKISELYEMLDEGSTTNVSKEHEMYTVRRDHGLTRLTFSLNIPTGPHCLHHRPHKDHPCNATLPRHCGTRFRRDPKVRVTFANAKLHPPLTSIFTCRVFDCKSPWSDTICRTSLIDPGTIALQAADKDKIATPANWKKGDDVIIDPSVSDEEAQKLFPGYQTHNVR